MSSHPLRRLGLAAALSLALTFPLAAQAESYKPLIPLLTDIPQWEADKADGMSMKSDGHEVVWATRQYRKGDAEISVILGVGHPMAGQAAAMSQTGKMQYEAGGSSYEVTTVKGFPVMRIFNKEERSGLMIVALASQSAPASLIVQFSDLEPEEGFAIAERFDWAKMQQALGK